MLVDQTLTLDFSWTCKDFTTHYGDPNKCFSIMGKWEKYLVWKCSEVDEVCSGEDEGEGAITTGPTPSPEKDATSSPTSSPAAEAKETKTSIKSSIELSCSKDKWEKSGEEAFKDSVADAMDGVEKEDVTILSVEESTKRLRLATRRLASVLDIKFEIDVSDNNNLKDAKGGGGGEAAEAAVEVATAALVSEVTVLLESPELAETISEATGVTVVIVIQETPEAEVVEVEVVVEEGDEFELHEDSEMTLQALIEMVKGHKIMLGAAGGLALGISCLCGAIIAKCCCGIGVEKRKGGSYRKETEMVIALAEGFENQNPMRESKNRNSLSFVPTQAQKRPSKTFDKTNVKKMSNLYYPEKKQQNIEW